MGVTGTSKALLERGQLDRAPRHPRQVVPTGFDGHDGQEEPAQRRQNGRRTPDQECPDWSGPGQLGCYWPPELAGDCDLSHWSSSLRSDDDRRVWDLRFRDAYLSWSTRDSQQTVRCVRTLQP